MSDFKLTLPRFEGNASSDFTLWFVRLEAILESKDLAHTILLPASGASGQQVQSTSIVASAVTAGAGTEQASAQVQGAVPGSSQLGMDLDEQSPVILQATQEQKRKAASIIINGLGDKPLRMVKSVAKEPSLMVAKLKERYESTKLSTRLHLMKELQSLRYRRGMDMGEYVDTFASVVERLAAMDAQIDEQWQVSLFLTSVEEQFETVVAALRTISNESVTWEAVTSRLIDEATDRRNKRNPHSGGSRSALFAGSRREKRRGPSKTSGGSPSSGGSNKKNRHCTYCGRDGHLAERCWNNPHSQNYRGGNSSAHSGRAATGQMSERKDGCGYNQGATGGSSNKEAHPKSSKHGKTVRFLAARSSDDQVLEGTGVLLDSGASEHMCPDKSWFTSLQNIEPLEVLLADNSPITCTSSGTVEVFVHNAKGKLRCVIQHVFYIPEMKHMLLSVSRLAEHGVVTTFSENGCTLRDVAHHGSVFATIVPNDGLFWLETSLPAHESSSYQSSGQQPPVSFLSAESTKSTLKNKKKSKRDMNEAALQSWHLKLGHIGKSKVLKLHENGFLAAREASKQSTCSDCVEAKQNRRPFKGSFCESVAPGDVIHSDVMGKLPRSRDRSQYVVSFIDEYTRHISMFPMHRKSEVIDCFKAYMVFFEKQSGYSVKCLHSDNGGEYEAVVKFAKENGIRISRSAPRAPQANGIAERANRTIVEMVRSALISSGVSKMYWTEAMSNALFIHNAVPDDSGSSAHERLYGRKVPLDRMKPFGCLVHVAVSKSKRDKLDAKTKTCVLLSNMEHKNYRVLNLSDKKISVETHVTFEEDKFPSKGDITLKRKELEDENTQESVDSFVVIQSSSSEEEGFSGDSVTSNDEGQIDSSSTDSPDSSDDEEGSNTSDQSDDDSQPDEEDNTDQDVEEANTPLSLNGQRRYPERVRKPPGRWWAYASQKSNMPEETCHSQTQDRYDPVSQQCHISQGQDDSPTLRTALRSSEKEQWREAINEELESLQQAGTWELTYAPRGVKVFPSKFVLRVKRTSSGAVERYKARLVLLGNLQRPNIDFFETYAPVVDFNVVRVILILALTQNMQIHQLDVKTAFLNGRLDEEIYMSLPDGFSHEDGRVCLLKRAIYGLRQAPKAWNDRLSSDLRSIGFKPITCAESVFVATYQSHRVYLLIYVDDMLIMCTCLRTLETVKRQLSKFYTVKDLGEAEFFLGVKMECSRDGGRCLLSQTSYIKSILERYGMQNAKPLSCPMIQPSDLMRKESRSAKEASEMVGVPYREAIGSIMYLAVRTRPDIAVAVGILAKHSQEPRPIHWSAVKRILRYLKYTQDIGLLLQKRYGSPELRVFVDADWGTDTESRCSRSGVLSLLGESVVAWKSRLQDAPSMSSCEAEYVALSEGSRATVWMRELLCELGACPGKEPTIILHDNQGSISWAEGGLRRVKHVELKYHYTQCLIESGQVRIQYVSSSRNAADGLTKALTGTHFTNMKEMWNLTDKSAIEREC